MLVGDKEDDDKGKAVKAVVLGVYVAGSGICIDEDDSPYSVDSEWAFSTRASRSMSLKVVVVVIVVLLLLVTHWKLTSPDDTFSTKLIVNL